MHCKYTFFIFLLLYAGLNIADNNAWDCEKVAGGEWTCASQVPVEATAVDEEVKDKRPTVKQYPTAEPLPLPRQAFISPAKLTHTERPPEKKLNQPGFTCKANDEEQGTWSCTSSKVDAVNIAQSSESSGFFKPAFNHNQELIFKKIHSQLIYDPWKNCTRSSTDNERLTDNDLRNTAPMYVSADYSEVFDKEVTSFFGNVDITRADQHIQSDRASYNTMSETMDAQGHVFYNENEISLYSNTVSLNLSTDEARLRDALFISPSGPIRGRADVVYRDSKYLSRYTNSAFTSCRPGNSDWVIHAERLKMNRQTGNAAAKHAWLEFKGLPVLYTPYISFPLDDRRVSGILPVSFSNSDKNGVDFSIPYYWNMAENYDLTLWPRYMSERGGMLGGEFRYLTQKTLSSFALEYLPYDLLRKEARFAGSLKSNAQIYDNLTSHIDLNYVSDKAYFDELNDTLGLSNNRFLKSQASLNYNVEGIRFFTGFETYQSIDRFQTGVNPYHILPQVNLQLDHSFEQWPIGITMDNQYINFDRDGRVSGHRFNTKSSIVFPFETAGSYIKPKVSVQYTQYELNNPDNSSKSISRFLPIVSVDSGLFFEKNFKFADSGFMHTLEPRLFYLYIPEKDQSDIQVFDSSLYDFGYSNLFRENRFSSIDRIQDANQVTVAMTSRLIDSNSGVERLNLSMGQIFYFQDRNVTLGGAPETNNFSNLVVELSSQLTDSLSLRSAMQWNPDTSDFTRAQADMKYRGEAGKILNLGYRYRKDSLDLQVVNSQYIIQTDASVRWPIYDNWFGVGRWQYSLKHNSTQESFLGLEKESCCWRFRVLWRRFANTITGNEDDTMETGVFVQIELKGLTGFGDKVDQFLEQNLKGYRRAE